MPAPFNQKTQSADPPGAAFESGINDLHPNRSRVMGLYWCGSGEAGEGTALELGNSALPSRPNTNN